MTAGYVVYKITNKENGKAYIGITMRSVQSRFSEHLSRSRYTKYKSKLHSALRKYGPRGFIVEPIYYALDYDHLKEAERLLIKEFNTLDSGYNLTEGGERQVFSPEVIKKIANTKMGHEVTEETREKLRNIFSKTYKITKPNGMLDTTDRLKDYCKINNITYGWMCKLANNKIKKYRGYSISVVTGGDLSL